jgi:hypothetical protein
MDSSSFLGTPCIYPGFFKFYQPKATGGGFLIFEWTLTILIHFKTESHQIKLITTKSKWQA